VCPTRVGRMGKVEAALLTREVQTVANRPSGFHDSRRAPPAQVVPVTTERLRPRTQRQESKDSERLSLAPLTFEEAVKAALATKPTKDADQDQDTDDDVS